VVHAIPFASFTNTTICEFDKLTFTNLSTTSDGTLTSNQWDLNGDNVADVDQPNPSYTYTLYGNYNVKLTVTTRYGCTDDTIRQVYVNPKAVGTFSSDNRSGCPELCINFKNTSTIISGTYTTTWDFGDGSPLNSYANPYHCYPSGNYDVNLTLVSDVGCTTKFSSPGYVSVFPVPQAGFKVDPDQVDEDEPIINVTNQASSDVNFIRYFVNDGSSFGSANFSHYIKNLKQTKPMVVQVVKNQYGCSDTLVQILDIKPAYVIYFPDVFTPNGDGLNDDFMPKGVGILKFNMQIYDRWGQQIFRTDDITNTWDGTVKGDDNVTKQDVYTWKAQVTDIFNKTHSLVGRVTVIK
jgi:gliding motility-associated-like protein